MRKKILSLLVLVSVISGCSINNIKPTNKNFLATQISGGEGILNFSNENMTDEAIAKMNTYINVRNFLDPALNDSINSYVERAGTDEIMLSGAKIPNDNALIMLTGQDYIIKAQSSLIASPKLVFDDVANNYFGIFTELLAKNNELYDFYKNNEYDLAKSKILHKEFIILINKYDKIYPDFIDKYDAWFLSLQLDNIRIYKQQGETAKYAVESISLYKKYLMDEIDAIDKKINKGNTSIDLNNLNKYLIKYEESVNYINSQNDDKIISNYGISGDIEIFNDIKKVSNELLRITKFGLLPLLINFDKIMIEKINRNFDKLYDLENDLINLRNKIIQK